MSSINEHVIQYLNFYVSLEESPSFAILLKGEWGIGKTFFINSYIDNFPKEKTKKFIYISLYGVGTYSDIDSQITKQIHPILHSKGMMIAEKVFKGAVKLGLKIDLDDDDKDDGTLTISLPDLPNKDTIKDYILVIDDLERSNMKIEQTMGYINAFVEQEGMKVIILANEEPLINNKKYLSIKEKTVGRTITIRQDMSNILQHFINTLTDISIKKFLNANIEALTNIYQFANYKNLRHLKQALIDCEYFISIIEPKYQEIIYQEQFLNIFFSFSFEIKKGAITPNAIRQLYDYEEKGKSILLTKYGNIFNRFNLILSLDNWYYFFDNGYIEREIVNASLQEIVDKISTEPTWLKLWNFRKLSDKEFSSTLEKFEQEWGDYHYNLPAEILHCLGLKLYFAKDFFNQPLNLIVQDFKLYIGYLIRNVWLTIDDKNLLNDDDSSYGYVFYSRESKEFQECYAYLNESIARYREEQLPKKGCELLKIMESNPKLFVEVSTLSNQSRHEFSETPILNFISSEDFLKVLRSLSNEDLTYIMRFFHDRYKHVEINMKLILEIKFLEQTKELINQQFQNSTCLSGYLLLKIANDSITNAIKQLTHANKMIETKTTSE